MVTYSKFVLVLKKWLISFFIYVPKVQVQGTLFTEQRDKKAAVNKRVNF